MKKSIFAALFHCASSEKNNWHDHCPKGKDTWCKFQQDGVNDANTYIAGAGLPLSVITHVKPIFLPLSVITHVKPIFLPLSVITHVKPIFLPLSVITHVKPIFLEVSEEVQVSHSL